MFDATQPPTKPEAMVRPPLDHPDAVLRGDIFWLASDESKGSIPGFAHPHVVVQDDVFNRSRLTSVIVCGLSTNAKLFYEPGNVLLQIGEGGVEKQCAVVVSQISSVLRSQLGHYVGTLTAERVDQVLAGLRLQQRSFFQRVGASEACHSSRPHSAPAEFSRLLGITKTTVRTRLAALLIAIVAVLATLASTAVPASVGLVYPGTMDCEQGCNFVAAGWPWPYLVDSHGISVRGSVSLSGGFTGEDIIFPGRMAVTFLFWLALASAIAYIFAWLRRRRSSEFSTVQSRGDA